MSEQITIAGRQVTVKGLTMAQIRQVMADLQKMQRDAKEVQEPVVPHVVDLVFDDDVPALAVAESTGLTLEELAGEIEQKEMRELLDKVRAANPFFVGAMQRLTSRVIQSSPSLIASAS